MHNKLFKIVLGILFISLAGCKEKNSEANYTVAGTIQNARNQKLMLQEVPYGGKPIITLDSTTLGADGKYAFDFIAKQEGIYRLATDNDLEIMFINDEEQIQIDADAANSQAYKVRGSKNSQALIDFLTAYKKKDSSVFATLYNLEQLQQQKAKDSSIHWLQIERTNKINALNQFVETTLSTATSPALLYYVLGISLRSMETAKVLALAKIAAEKTKAEPLIQFSNLLNSQLQANTPATPIAIGAVAPEIALANEKGEIVTLSSFKGKYVLVDFWASWCGPCRGENPNVVAAYEKYKNKNFTVLGVSLDDNKENWLEAIKADKLNWQHISDLKKWESTVVPTYQIEGIPFNVLLDTTGKIIAKDLRGQALQATLAGLFP
jgi:peroxiredoxin